MKNKLKILSVALLYCLNVFGASEYSDYDIYQTSKDLAYYDYDPVLSKKLNELLEIFNIKRLSKEKVLAAIDESNKVLTQLDNGIQVREKKIKDFESNFLTNPGAWLLLLKNQKYLLTSDVWNELDTLNAYKNHETRRLNALKERLKIFEEPAEPVAEVSVRAAASKEGKE